jgi:hypothetical protein
METQTLTRAESFDCDGPAELDIRIRSGRIEVRTTDTPSLRVEISPEPGDGDPHVAHETQVDFSGQRRRLAVRAPRGLRRAAIAVVIEAPRGSRLEARAHQGSISASGPLSGLAAATGGGSITADEIEGPAQVASGSGRIRLGQVAGPLKARLGSGDLEAASIAGEGAAVATGQGDVWLGVVGGNTNVRTGRGGIVVAEAAGGTITLATGAGDVRVGIRPGVAAEIDVASGSGRVRSELDVTDNPPAGGPAARIRMRTGAGEAVVERAGGTERAG